MNNWKLLLLAIGLFFWSEIRSETFNDCFDLRYMMMDYLKDNSLAVSDSGNYSLDFARELATVNANWLRWTLFGMEVAFKNGNMEEFKRLSAVSSRFILFLEENLDLLGDALYVRNRLMFMYSISRMIVDQNVGNVFITSKNVRDWLPCPKHKMLRENRHILLQEKFKVLLVVGVSINGYRRRTGRLPSDLHELIENKELGLNVSDLYFDGMKIVYVHDSAFWKLGLGGDNCKEEPLYDFMPSVDYVAGMKCEEIWFASNYWEKRRELFDKGFLDSKDIRCRCYLKRNIIYRGSPRKEIFRDRVKDESVGRHCDCKKE